MRRAGIEIRKASIYGLLLGVSVVSLFPIIWGLRTSLMPSSDIFSSSPVWIPKQATIEHYKRVLLGGGGYFLRAILNSVLVGVATVAVTLAVAILASYTTARLALSGSRVILVVLLATTMIPGIATLVPLYVLANIMKIYNTYAILIAVHAAWRIPMAIWVLHGFFREIPTEIEESALIDGCTRFQAFLKVLLPLAKPGIAAAAILSFIYVWQDFLIGFVLVTSRDLHVAPVALYYYLDQFGIRWGELMAATTLTYVPAVVAFLVFQRQLIYGLTAGAVKE